MKQSIIDARIVRSGLPVTSGIHYRDARSELIQNLVSNGKSVFVGIENNDGLYTALGIEKVFYLIKSGDEREILNSEFREILRKYSFSVGKTGVFDFIPIDKNEQVWVKDGPTMNALWNILLMFKTMQ